MKSIDGFERRTPINKQKVVHLSRNEVPYMRQRRSLEKISKPLEVVNESEDDWAILLANNNSVKTLNKPKEELEQKEKKVKSKKPKKKWKLIVLLVLIALIGVGLKWADNYVRKITSGKSGVFDAIGAVVGEEEKPLNQDSQGRTNVLLFGTSGYDMNGSGNGGVHDGASLTDSIMVVSLDQKTGDIAMVNLPRDLKVGNTCTATGKINELYWCSNMYGKNELAGAEALRLAVEKILNIKIQYFGHLNWGALVKVVDTLGGVTVVLDENIADDWTKTYIKKGVPTTLNGERALGLARARHGTVGGDFSRGNSQQKLLMAIQKRMKEKNIGFNEVMNLVDILGDNLRTDFKVDEIKTALRLSSRFDLGNIRQVALINYSTGETLLKDVSIGGISYIVPMAGVHQYKEIQDFIKVQFSSDSTEREQENILILNGSGVSGAAVQERVKLEQKNFKVGGIGDAAGEFNEAEYYLYTNNKLPGKKKLLEDFYKIKARGMEELPASITANNLEKYDFVIILGKKV